MPMNKSYVRFSPICPFQHSDAGLVISPNLLEIYVFWELVA